MKTPDLSDARSRHRIIAVLAALVAVLVLAGVGVYGLLAGPPTANEDANRDSGPGPAVTAPSDPASTATPRLPSVSASADPETFARNVATALFAWDTASGFMPLDYTSVVLAVGDPSGAEQAGLAADIATYLPTQSAWAQLRPYAATQRLEITSVFVPDAWADALAQARPGQLPDGAAAYTIEGIRQRSGVWNGDPVTAEHPVAFTIFIACPAEDPCYVLRLSQLNNPLR